jgi:hypothetical protein
VYRGKIIRWNWKICFWASAFTAALCMARIAVSIGRLIYCIQTGTPLAGAAELPAWYTLILEDGFFYVGIAALLWAMVCAWKCRKERK